MPNESGLQIFKRGGYAWTKNAEAEIKNYIRDAYHIVRNEAERCDCLKLLNDDELYRQFKQNLDFEEEYANVILCKILILKLQLKVLYWQLGKYLFTENEREMLEYFCEREIEKVLTRKAFKPEKTICRDIKRKTQDNNEFYYAFTFNQFNGRKIYNRLPIGKGAFFLESFWAMSQLNWILRGERERISAFFDMRLNVDHNYISVKEYYDGVAAEEARKKELAKYVDTMKAHNEIKNDRIASLENLLNKGRYD